MSRRPSIPSYRLHKATRQAIVTLGGTMFYLGVYGSPESREEYDRKIAEWLWHCQRCAMTRGVSAMTDFYA